MKVSMYIHNCAFLVLITLASCSSGIQVQEIPNTANVSQELQAFETDMNNAAADQANLLSPNNFKEAEKSLKTARESLDKQKAPKDTLHQIATGRAYLKRAKEVEALSRTNMEEVVIARQQAITAGAPVFFPSDFKKADDDLRDVTTDLEKNNIKSVAKNREVLQASYMKLELRAIKRANMGYAQKTISQAIKEDAKKYAPQTLAIAEKKYKDTDAYITANRHEPEEIKTRTDLLNQSVDHLLKITHDSVKTKKVLPEELALQMEKKQNQLTENQQDLTNEKNVSQSLNEQKAALQKEVTEKKSDLLVEQSISESLAVENRGLEEKVAESQKDLTAEKVAAESLLNEKKSLESEKALNDNFEKARSEFTKNEAEVYKQGNSLTIRLRGLKFPSSKADLKESNFPLLGKVQKVIEKFGRSAVVVEGHTDSVGGKTINDKISQDRALAVREYFISNGIIPDDKIQAIGYGEKKPLATNKTAAGRAQNRRVDVVIKVDESQRF